MHPMLCSISPEWIRGTVLLALTATCSLALRGLLGWLLASLSHRVASQLDPLTGEGGLDMGQGAPGAMTANTAVSGFPGGVVQSRM